MGIEEIPIRLARRRRSCMATGDFRRAFEAFAAKAKPDFRELSHGIPRPRPQLG